jgi:hypothetical protein
MESRLLISTAPRGVANAMPRDFVPIAYGVCTKRSVYMRGQKFNDAYKFIPDTNAMPKERPTIRWPAKISLGTIGYFVPFHSQRTNAATSSIPIMRGQRTEALFHGWVYPPDCRATKLL